MSRPTRPDIPSLVARVVEDHRSYQASIQSEREAEVALLESVLEDVRPALPALMSAMNVADPLVRRGVRLCDRGDVTLALLEDGSWAATRVESMAEVTATGGSARVWVREAFGVQELLSRGWDGARIIQGLVEALECQAQGNKVHVTAKITERASRLRAVCQLIRGKR